MLLKKRRVIGVCCAQNFSAKGCCLLPFLFDTGARRNLFRNPARFERREGFQSLGCIAVTSEELEESHGANAWRACELEPT